MKKLIIWIATLIATLVIADLILGLVFGMYVSHKGLQGDYESTDYILRHNDNDVLILGSSVGLNSLNAKQIEDSIGMKTFNASANGQTFPFFLSMLKSVADQEHKPHTVLLLVNEQNMADTGIGKRYNFLSPYYGNSIGDIDERLEQRGKCEGLFLKSNAYRLNTIWFRILLYNFMSAGIKGENGSISKPVPPVFPERNPYQPAELSEERRENLKEFIEICKDNNISLMMVVTPQYLDTLGTRFSPLAMSLKEISETNGFPFYFDLGLQPFAADSTLFYDNTHININGTDIYTPIIIERLRKILPGNENK